MPLEAHPFSEEELMAYLDGELPPRQAQDIGQHLAGCRTCQSLAADLQSVSRSLQDWQAPAPSLRLSAPRVETAPKIRLRWRPSRRWVTGGAVAAGLLGLVVVNHYSVPPLTESSRDMRFTTLEQYAQPQQGSIRDAPLIVPHEARSAKIVSEDRLIVRTAEMSLTTQSFNAIRAQLEQIVKDNGGYVGQLSISSATGQARSLSATVRVPASRLDGLVAQLRDLGHVESESQNSEEVTRAYVDLQARLTNLRETEQRLTAILRERTGKLADVLAVEEQIDVTRGHIERAEAEQKTLSHRIAFASLQLTVAEQYQRHLSSDHGGAVVRFRNAAVKGYQTVLDVASGLLVFALSYGPLLLIIGAILFWPARLAAKKLRLSTQNR